MNIEKNIKGFHGVVGIANCWVYVADQKKKVWLAMMDVKLLKVLIKKISSVNNINTFVLKTYLKK